MAKKHSLMRGLDEIFLENSFPEDQKDTDRPLTVSISLIDVNPGQPRKNFEPEALASLAQSISENGLLQPILTRKIEDRYEIIAGERRFRASKLAGLAEVPVVVVDADNLTAARYALIENIQREDLNPYEEAKAYSTLMTEYDLSQEEVASQVGKSRSAVANSLRLLDLPEEVVQLLVDGSLTAGHGRALLGLRDKSQIVPLAQRCANRSLSVRDLESVVKRSNRAYLKSLEEVAESDEVTVDYYQSLEARFTGRTGRRCKIIESRNKKLFQLEYQDNEDLEAILKLLGGNDILDEY